MSSAYDPYQDDDAVSVDMSAAYTEPESPFSKTLKQMGQAIKSGQFCSINKENDEDGKREKSVAADTTMDMTVTDDSQDEQIVTEKSVSFSEAEPLIVDDVVVSVDESNPQDSEDFELSEIVDEPKSSNDEVKKEESKTEEQPVQENVQKCQVNQPTEKKSYGAFLVVFFILIVCTCIMTSKFNYLNPQLLNEPEQISSTMQEYSAMIQMRIEETGGIDMPKMISGSVSALIFLVSLNAFFSDEKRFKAFIEFVWGVFICSVVMTGMYFTYDLTA